VKLIDKLTHLNYSAENAGRGNTGHKNDGPSSEAWKSGHEIVTYFSSTFNTAFSTLSCACVLV